MQRHLHAAAICSQIQGAEYVGVAFGRNHATKRIPYVRSLHSAMNMCARYELITPSGSLFSARSILIGNASQRLSASCAVLIVNMEAPTAAARQTLVSDLHIALSLALVDSPALLVLAGLGCDTYGGEVDDLGREVDGGGTYINAFGQSMLEQCWVQHAWTALLERGHVQLPPPTEPNECERIGERLWCIGQLVSGANSICRARPPKLQLSNSDNGGGNDHCKTTHRVVGFPKGAPPDWDSEGSGAPRALPFRSFEKGVAHGYRHYTLLPCPHGDEDEAQSRTSRLCLIFKSSWRFMAGLQSVDGGRTFSSSPASLVLPAATNNTAKRFGLCQRMTANMAITHDPYGKQFVIVGGRYRPSTDAEPGVWMAVGQSWRWSTLPPSPPQYVRRGLFRVSPVPAPENWRDFRLLFNGTHSGCAEDHRVEDQRRRYLIHAVGRRNSSTITTQSKHKVCGFGSRLSLVRHGQDWIIYARARLEDGLQWVQMTRSNNGQDWLPFQLINILGFDAVSGFPNYFAAQTNPIHNGSLLSLVPIVHRLHACIGITFSVNGLDWSPVIPLVPCSAYGDRASHHPVAGGLVSVGYGRVACFIHEDVPKIAADHAIQLTIQTPMDLDVWVKRYASRKRRNRNEQPSRIVRIEFPCERLASWTRRGLQTLGAASKSFRRKELFFCVPRRMCR